MLARGQRLLCLSCNQLAQTARSHELQPEIRLLVSQQAFFQRLCVTARRDKDNGGLRMFPRLRDDAREPFPQNAIPRLAR